MASFPFRPPQFSDDVAWLPAWIQSSQAATPLDECNEELLKQSLQNLDPFKGENNQVKGHDVLLGTESRYNCRLYLSGEENSQVTLTSSCSKMLHFNLHLSTDGISSIISTPLLEISEYDRVNCVEGKLLQSGEALQDSRETSKTNIDHNSSDVNNFPSSNEKGSGDVSNQPQFKSSNAKQDVLETFNSKGFECDDIDDAVELSVAASEALVIHELVQNGSDSEASSAAAVLEIALRVKRARLEGLQDSMCCSKDGGNTTDHLSDLCDTDMEEAYDDVGLSISSLDTVLSKDPSISRVKDTPMLETHPGQERDVESEVHIDHNFNRSAGKPLEENLGASKLKDMPTENIDSEKQEKLCRSTRLDRIVGSAYQSQHGNSDDLQGDKSMVIVHGLSQKIGVESYSQDLMSGKANEFTPLKWNSHCIDMDNLNDNSCCGFRSRWFGGWTGKEGVAYVEAVSNGRKAIPKPFIGETSYLSESADVASDQNSFVHNYHYCSKASESILPLEDSSETATGEAVVDQDAVKDSNSSFIDPLCSIVPCSISVELDSSRLVTNNNDNLGVLATDKSLTPGLNIPLEDVQTNSGHNDESVSRNEHNQLSVNTIGPDPIICRQLTSLRPYSVGLPGNPLSLFSRSFNCGLAMPEECNSRWLSGKQEGSCTNFPNGNDIRDPPPVRSTSDCTAARSNEETDEMRMVSVEQHISSTNMSDGKVHRKQPAFRSMFRFTTKINNEETHETSGPGNAFGRSIQDYTKGNAENGAELHVHLQGLPASPLVLCHRTRRRFKAPQLPVTDSSVANQVEGQAPGSVLIHHKSRENPQDQHKMFPDTDVPVRKRVRFSETDVEVHPKKNLKRRLPSCRIRSSHRVRNKPQHLDEVQGTASQEVKERLTNCRIKGKKRTIFQGLEFLLTGFSKKKEKEIEGLLRKHGGMVLPDIPDPTAYPRGRRSSRYAAQRLPVVLSTKKLQTTKFLFGCAVNAFLLKVGWAYDSIKAGSVLPPDKYVILSNQSNGKLNQIGRSVSQNNDDYIFDKVGIMLHGRHSFCSKLLVFIKHGGGFVYKSLQWLIQSIESKKICVAAIVAEDENHATRHLKKCASEQKIPVVPGSWIINSLFEGKLIPFPENYHSSRLLATKVPEVFVSREWSQEI